MKYLSFSIPGYPDIQAPSGVPMGGKDTAFSILGTVITFLFIITIVLSLFFLIFGGISVITSEGDKQKLQNAKNRITFSIIGLVIALLAYLIINIIGNFFTVPLTNPL